MMRRPLTAELDIKDSSVRHFFDPDLVIVTAPRAFPEHVEG